MTRNPGRAYCRGPDAADRDAVWLFSILVLFSRTSNGFSLGRALSDRVVERPRRLAEPRRPAVLHVKAVLASDAKFAGDVVARLVREAHAGVYRGPFALHQIHRLVPSPPPAAPPPCSAHA